MVELKRRLRHLGVSLLENRRVNLFDALGDDFFHLSIRSFSVRLLFHELVQSKFHLTRAELAHLLLISRWFSLNASWTRILCLLLLTEELNSTTFSRCKPVEEGMFPLRVFWNGYFKWIDSD